MAVAERAAGNRTYIVECYARGGQREDVEAAGDRVRRATSHLHAAGIPIVYVGALFMPDDEVVLHVFRAPEPDHVHEAVIRAALESTRVVESILISNPGTPVQDAWPT